MSKLNLKALAIAIGAAWSLCVFLAGLAASFGWCSGFVEVVGSIYIGYKPGLLGAVVGAAWAFFDGAIFGLIIGLVYNRFSRPGGDSN